MFRVALCDDNKAFLMWSMTITSPFDTRTYPKQF